VPGYILQVAVQPLARDMQLGERLLAAELSSRHQDADGDADLTVHLGSATRVDIVAEVLSDLGK
jgi:hypothetical protein